MNSKQTIASDSANTRIELTGVQDVRVAGDLHRNLIELLSTNQAATLDCTDVDSLDAAAIQLMLAAKRETGDKLSILASEETQAASWIALSGLKNRLLPSST